MAVSKIKATYSLDVETTRELARVAKRWKVSKSEALARAIHAASALEVADPVHLLDSLQASLRDQKDAIEDWANGTVAERHASSSKREPR